MKILLFISIIFFNNFGAYSQSGILSPQFEKIRKSYVKNDFYTKNVTNAVTNNAIKDLALNRQNIGKFDHEFKYKVNVKGICNQKQSGRCWMFTSMSILRYKTISKYDLSGFEFSHNYLYFWDMFEKANTFPDIIIKNKKLSDEEAEIRRLYSAGINDGGAWNYFVNLSLKYGLVPKEIMPETKQSENTGAMIAIINEKLREYAIKIRENKTKSDAELNDMKILMLSEIYRILAICLGEPPTSFEWRFPAKTGANEMKTFTPIEFMNETVENPLLNDYVMFIDDPSREYYKLYEKEDDSNLSGGLNWTFINLPVDVIKPFALASIKDNEAMYFSCDVGKQLNIDAGLLDLENYDYKSIFGIDFPMNKKQRIISQQSGSSHGMALMAVDTDQNGKTVKWQVENSWGNTSGKNGYLTITERWFDQYMFRIVIRKEYIDPKILEILNQKPIPVPAWNPAFMSEN